MEMILLLCAMAGIPQSFSERLQSLGVAETPRVMVVSVRDQKMTLFESGRPRAEYAISTAEKGVGQKLDSYQTPLGLHRIKQKIGGERPSGAIFENREFKGEIWVPPSIVPREATTPKQDNRNLKEGAPATADLMTSRILWLEGMEPGVNSGNDKEGCLVDSYQRFIYIHGTNHEDEIGRPTSRGCIRMKNVEVIRFFDRVQEGDLVLIQE